jgi:hypothetical protein
MVKAGIKEVEISGTLTEDQYNLENLIKPLINLGIINAKATVGNIEVE